jgi:hypothetical protein
LRPERGIITKENNSAVFWEEAMTESRPFSLMDLILVLGILGAAAGLRAGYLLGACNQGNDDGPIQVQDEWTEERDVLVSNLKEGHGFKIRAPLAPGEEATAHTSIGYPWLVALLEGALAERPSAHQMVRWIQCGLGALTAALYFLFGRKAFNSLLVGALAGLLTAVHPFWIASTAEINDGVLATFLLALGLFLGVRGGQRGGALTSLLFGLVLAGLSCVRAALFPFAVVAVLWYLLRCRTLPRGWLYAVVAFLGFINGLIPWTVRNYQTFNTVVPLVDSAYLHLWIGNHLHATGGPLSDDNIRKTLVEIYGEDEGKKLIRELEALPQPQRYNLLGWKALTEIQNDPAVALDRRLRAGLGFFVGTNWLEKGAEERSLWRGDLESQQNDWAWLNRAVPIAFKGSLLVMLFLGVIGWRWTYAWRYESLPGSLAVFWVPLPYFLSHAESYSGPRLPLDGVLLTYAAFVVVSVIPGIGSFLFRTRPHE